MKLERAHNDRAWLAWHIAALHRAKKLPPLKKLQVKLKRKKVPMTWQQQLQVLTKWNNQREFLREKRDGNR